MKRKLTAAPNGAQSPRRERMPGEPLRVVPNTITYVNGSIASNTDPMRDRPAK